MWLSFKELVIVLIVASAIFKVVRPVALTFASTADFSRRRRTWFALTIVAFLSPSFWLFVAFAIPILLIAGRKDSNPVAVYLMLLHVVPPVNVKVPIVGTSYLFELNNFLLLSFCVLTPAAVQMLRADSASRNRDARWMDVALLAYGVLSAFEYLHQLSAGGTLYAATITDSIRRVVVFFFISYVPYFVTSRSNIDRRVLMDSLASYCIGVALLAGVAIFESLKGWLLYLEMSVRWGEAARMDSYLFREHTLRAMASSGHPLALGTLLMIAFAFWLYLRARVESPRSRLLISLLLGAGLFVTYSRGPWIGAATAYFVFMALRRRNISSFVRTIGGVFFAGTLLSFTPLGQRVIGLLPFFGGQTDIGTLDYRERLLERSWEIISSHPLLGDPTALLRMQDLRQGQGIIDLVNVYIQVMLNDGLVGLTLLFGFILIGLCKVNITRRRVMGSDPDMNLLGAMLMSAIFGLLVTMAGGSFGGGTERMYYQLGAFAAAYVAANNPGLRTVGANRPIVIPGTGKAA